MHRKLKVAMTGDQHLKLNLTWVLESLKCEMSGHRPEGARGQISNEATMSAQPGRLWKKSRARHMSHIMPIDKNICICIFIGKKMKCFPNLVKVVSQKLQSTMHFVIQSSLVARMPQFFANLRESSNVNWFELTLTTCMYRCLPGIEVHNYRMVRPNFLLPQNANSNWNSNCESYPGPMLTDCLYSVQFWFHLELFEFTNIDYWLLLPDQSHEPRVKWQATSDNGQISPTHKLWCQGQSMVSWGLFDWTQWMRFAKLTQQLHPSPIVLQGESKSKPNSPANRSTDLGGQGHLWQLTYNIVIYSQSRRNDLWKGWHTVKLCPMWHCGFAFGHVGLFCIKKATMINNMNIVLLRCFAP